MTAATSAAPLHGLLLAGGRSRRMGRDKAALEYQGAPQLERAMALLERHVERAFLSVRPDQARDPLRSRFQQIADTRADVGPVAGLLAAQASNPGVAWLVLACDLPRLTADALARLVSSRAAARVATAYLSSHDRLPEPLCAIYEPASREPLIAWVDSGERCPRRFLLAADALLLEPADPHALDNVNTPQEYARLVAEPARVPRR